MKKFFPLVLIVAIAAIMFGCGMNPSTNGMVIASAPCPPAPTPEVAKVIKISEHVMFDWDSDVIREDQKPILDKVAGFLVKYPDTILVIEGYASEEGATDYNLALSTRRAESVRAGLQARGVAPANIKSVVGDGETTIFGDALKENRRVLVLSVD